MKQFLALCLFSVAAVANPPSLLNNSEHITGTAISDLTILSGITPGGIPFSTTAGPTAGMLAINQTCSNSDPTCTTTFLSSNVLIANAANIAQAEYAANSSTVVTPSVPYAVLNQSSTGYSLSGSEQSNYAALEAAGIVYAMAFCQSGDVPSTDYPAVGMSTILPNSVGSVPGCGWGPGIEFSMSANYLGFDTSEPSTVTEGLSAILMAVKYVHPTWTWGDVKGGLRQTASSWATGYNWVSETIGGVAAFGYGNINYAAAIAITSPSSIYLQAPGMSVTQPGGQHYAVITLYPFVTTRRAKEVVYVGGTWPAPNALNEMTAAQIAAAGGTKIIDDAGATGVQSFTFAPAASGSATFTAITLDSTGNGSRVESFSSVTETFVVGTACLQ